MAIYTKISKKDVVSIERKFNLGKIISFKGIKKGIENTNYLIRTKNKKYILTILKTDGSLLKIEMRWPKGENRLVKPGRAHKRLKSGKYI